MVPARGMNQPAGRLGPGVLALCRDSQAGAVCAEGAGSGLCAAVQKARALLLSVEICTIVAGGRARL